MDEDQFFDGQPVAHAIHVAVAQAIARIGPAEIRVSKGQVGSCGITPSPRHGCRDDT